MPHRSSEKTPQQYQKEPRFYARLKEGWEKPL